jgi:S1-C subfamily serine protease
MRITGTNPGQPAQNAGLKSGDIIVALGDTPLEDIYGYMGALNTLEVGQKTTITIIRDGVEQTLELQL